MDKRKKIDLNFCIQNYEVFNLINEESRIGNWPNQTGQIMDDLVPLRRQEVDDFFGNDLVLITRCTFDL